MNGDGNFKIKCVCVNGNYDYTEGKIYEVVNGGWIDDDGDSVGNENLKTIEDVNKWSHSTWELVEEEISEPIKEEKPLLEIVMEYLGVKEGEEFNIVWGSRNGGSSSTLNPFMFKDGELLNKYKNSCDDYLGALIAGKYKIEKLPWKPKNGHIVWYILTNQRTDDGKFENLPHSFTFKSNNLTHLALYKSDWMFRTKKEAEANMERVLKEMKEVTGDE